jgi:hypothetical protein
MGAAITWLVAFFVTVTTAFAAITGVMDTSSSRTEALADSDQRVIAELESSFKIVGVSQSNGHQRIELIVTNNGRRAFTDFKDWDITVRYDQTGSPEETDLVPFYSETLVDGSWVTASFWLEHDSQAELIEPGILNPHEEVEIHVQVNPKLEHGTWVVVTFTSPYGVTESIAFEA